MKVYVYMGIYETGKKRIETNVKDIEKAYSTMLSNFGNKGFKELYYSYSKVI